MHFWGAMLCGASRKRQGKLLGAKNLHRTRIGTLCAPGACRAFVSVVFFRGNARC